MGVALSVGQALAILRDAILESVRYDPRDLTQRQTAVMLMVYLSSTPMTVRGLATALAVGKPAISRAFDRLEALGLLRRMPDTRDRRSIIVARTFAGTVYVRELADRMVTAAALSQD